LTKFGEKMQDKYVGDVGDFGKYILLNCLSDLSGEDLKLGVNWYYVTRPEPNSGDGRYTDYLEQSCRTSSKYKAIDPDLFSTLKTIISRGRTIKAIENSGVLPQNTIFYSNPVPYSASDAFLRERDRELWFQSSIDRLKNSNIIFLDPDNGIQTPRIRKTQIKAIKYVFWNEIIRYYESGKSLVIYNHRDYKPKNEYDFKFREVQRLIGRDIMVLRFKRYQVRDYLLLPRDGSHEQLFTRLIKKLTDPPYNFLFESYHF